MAEAEGRLWANHAVVGVQSRLYSPGYVGPARWVLFEPRARRAFSALGKDVVPDAIAALVGAANGASAADLVEAHDPMTAGSVESLLAAGLLLAEPGPAPGSLLSSFHRANIDYPFFDYGSPSVVEHESQLLDRYAALWPPPPPVLAREGRRHELPPLGASANAEAGGSLTLGSLAWILHTVLAPIGEIRTRHVTCVRRTTPSGGSRHPTEIAVVIGHPLGDLPTGTYTYDVATHALVAEPEGVHAAYSPKLRGRPFGLVVRTRVERAMWRYRDLRALRPVLIDAGHVVEMLTFLLARNGLPTEVTSPPVAPVDARWLDEPEVALVLPSVGRDGRVGVSQGRTLLPSDDADTYLTNPGLVLRFGGGLHAQVLWPSPRDLRIGLTEFLILNHCLPSTRGDRDTSTTGIVNAVPGAAAAQVQRLREAGALLGDRSAEVLHTGSRLWIRHDWYLAMLAYLEAASSGVEEPVASRTSATESYISDLETVFRRRTARAFPPAPVDFGSVDALLGRAIPAEDQRVVDVMLAAWNVHGLRGGLYRWQKGTLTRIGEAPTRAEVARSSAGQTAAAAGALALWVSVITDVEQPQRYIMDLIDLGRLGQRICLSATELGMAVFLTPAVYDRATCAIVCLDQPERRLTYVFGVGARRRDKASAG